MILRTHSFRILVLLIFAIFSFAGSLMRVQNDPSRASRGPTTGHPLGFSPYGHDVLLWSINGLAKTAMQSAATTALTLCVGTLIGLKMSSKRNRIVDRLAFSTASLLDGLGPWLISACLLSAIPRVHTGILSLFIAMISWSGVAFVVRSEILAIKQCAFFEAALVLGVQRHRLFTAYVLPVLSERLVPLSLALFTTFAGVFGALAFLGLGSGTQDSLGFMIFDSQNYLRAQPFYFVGACGAFLMLLGGSAICTRLFSTPPWEPSNIPVLHPDSSVRIANP